MSYVRHLATRKFLHEPCAVYSGTRWRRSKLVITSSGVWRGTKTLVLKDIVDDGIKLAEKSGHKVRLGGSGMTPCRAATDCMHVLGPQCHVNTGLYASHVPQRSLLWHVKFRLAVQAFTFRASPPRVLVR